MNTQSASAAVVEREPVGGVKPGMTVQTLEVATNRKSVPRNARYFLGSAQANVFDLPLNSGDNYFKCALPA